jgi:hypothetical protein
MTAVVAETATTTVGGKKSVSDNLKSLLRNWKSEELLPKQSVV